MKRLLIGAGWFAIFFFAALVIGGAIVGAMASGPAADAAEAYQAGQAAGEAFGQTYGDLIFLVSIVAAAIGTFMGWLPGTKLKDAAARKTGNQQVDGAQAGSAGTVSADNPDPLAAIKKLGELMEAGMITEQEYENKKAKLLDRV